MSKKVIPDKGPSRIKDIFSPTLSPLSLRDRKMLIYRNEKKVMRLINIFETPSPLLQDVI